MPKNAMPKPSTKQLLTLSFFVHIALLLYANHVDTNPHKFGGLKYTDVDWNVVSDGARLIFDTSESVRAQGWLTRLTGWRIGDPYLRPTFRYTPLLPLLLSPTIFHPFIGKLILVPISLSIPLLLLYDPNESSSKLKRHSKYKISTDIQARETTIYTRLAGPAPFWATHLLWTLNPLVLNITTRGSPEATIVFLVVLVQTCLRLAASSPPDRPTSPSSHLQKSVKKSSIQSQALDSHLGHNATNKQHVKWEILAGIAYALSISWKLYPVIYFSAIWCELRRRYGWFGWGVWRFGLVVVLGLVVINGSLWSIWGYPFLQHTYLHHLTRLDHRHNFSPYFYPIYLSLFSSSPPPSSVTNPSSTYIETTLSLATRVLRHPLTSFLPQTSLVLITGFLVSTSEGVNRAMFIQTIIFVIFNKVCTSQYFIWFLPLLPSSLPINLSNKRTITITLLWIISQAIWLSCAYRLELMALDWYLWVWAAGIGVFAVGVWGVGEVLDGLSTVRDEERVEIRKRRVS